MRYEGIVAYNLFSRDLRDFFRLCFFFFLSSAGEGLVILKYLNVK